MRNIHEDHPRSRGVYQDPLHPDDATRGSSPLARGLLRGGVCGDRAQRIIPARAGFTGIQTVVMAVVGDHPRSRGVYAMETGEITAVEGSSPLARGLPLLQATDEPVEWIIPARAGFTRSTRGRRRSSRDHPRSRGVYDVQGGGCGHGLGSSPLARGLPVLAASAQRADGIIPARAGFTAAVRSPWHGCSDHPRSRGVYPFLSARRAAMRGSSPLARGLLHNIREQLTQTRIIPARAGFTTISRAFRSSAPDHPRSRGVYADRRVERGVVHGSSPLARGLLKPSALEKGIGKDHPRSRGVYRRYATETRDNNGSSPLARGLQEDDDAGDGPGRIIPARAGFTPPSSR